jgi:hypothetical protein
MRSTSSTVRPNRKKFSAPASSRISIAHAGFDNARKPPRRHAVGLVGEPFRPHLEEVPQQAVLEQLRVQRGNAVDA